MRFPRIARAFAQAVPGELRWAHASPAATGLEGGLTAADHCLRPDPQGNSASTMSDISSGGIASDARTPTTPGYNVAIAGKVQAAIPGLAYARRRPDRNRRNRLRQSSSQGKADMVALARAVLDDPHWGWHAARAQGVEANRPKQYSRATPSMWPGAALRT